MYSTSYVRTKNIYKYKNPQSIDSNSSRQVFLQGGSGVDLDYHFENFVELVGRKDNYFRRANVAQGEEDDD